MLDTAVNGRPQGHGTLGLDHVSCDSVRTNASSILSSYERCIELGVARTQVIRSGRSTMRSPLHRQQVNHFIEGNGLGHWIRGLSYHSGQAILRSLVVHDDLNFPSSSW